MEKQGVLFGIEIPEIEKKEVKEQIKDNLQYKDNCFQVLNMEELRTPTSQNLISSGLMIFRKQFEEEVKKCYNISKCEWKELTLDEEIAWKGKELKELLKKKFGCEVSFKVEKC
jgi:hypothetical protein